MGRWGLLLTAVLSAILAGGCSKEEPAPEPQPLSEEEERKLDRELRRAAEQGGESRQRRDLSRKGEDSP